MKHPKFIQIQLSPSYLMALDEDGEVWQLIEYIEESQGILYTQERKCEWVKAEDVTAEQLQRRRIK